MPAAMLHRVLHAYASSLNRPRLIMLVSFAAFVLNVPLNYIFIYKNKCSLKIWKSFQNNVKSKNLYSKLDVHIEKSISDGMVKPFLGEKQYWYNIMDVATVIMTVFAFLFVIMFYNTMVIGRIKRFSNEVVNISSGNLQSEIRVDSRDEIGRLAMSVDNMRNSLLETMNNEKAAWAANTALITAMSHDVRTPLTSLIGYLDIIEGKKFRTEEDLIRYIHSCREKAFQLKDLSDELFSYFLVFGNPGNAELEEVDAGILFQQLLGEHVAEVLNYGRNITLTYDIPEDVWVKVNVSSLRRLFDNLFSNILKYAGKDFPVEVCATYSENRIEILFRNTIWKEAKQRESTKIGVKTCRKLTRSEERRVGKECRSRWSPYH